MDFPLLRTMNVCEKKRGGRWISSSAHLRNTHGSSAAIRVETSMNALDLQRLETLTRNRCSALEKKPPQQSGAVDHQDRLRRDPGAWWKEEQGPCFGLFLGTYI